MGNNSNKGHKSPFRLWLGRGVAGLCVVMTMAGTTHSDPLDIVHPGYTMKSILPADWKPMVSGLDFLSDGRLLVLTHYTSRSTGSMKPGQLYMVDNPYEDVVSYKKVADGMVDPTSLRVIDDRVYIGTKFRLVELLKLDGTAPVMFEKEVADKPGEYHTIHDYGWDDGRYHDYATGIVLKDGFWYMVLGIYPVKSSNMANRGAMIKFPEEGGAEEIVATGIRSLGGLERGPDGMFFVPDNQGEWNPVSTVWQLKEGRFYGIFDKFEDPLQTAAGSDKSKISPPALWLDHKYISNSPSQPLNFPPSSQYYGQMVAGEVQHSGLNRYFFEAIMVNGEKEYQGAVFRFSGDFTASTNRLVFGEDDALFIGGIGTTECGCWNYGSDKHGLWRMTPKMGADGQPVQPFDFLAARNLGATGFELEFTHPVGPSAGVATNYSVSSWFYEPTGSYGGPRKGEEDLTVTSAAVSEDNLRVELAITGLKEGHVVGIILEGVTSAAGETPVSNEALYNLNWFGPGIDTQPYQVVSAKQRREKQGIGMGRLPDGAYWFRNANAGEWHLWDLQGRLVDQGRSAAAQRVNFAGSTIPEGTYIFQWISGKDSFRRTVVKF